MSHGTVVFLAKEAVGTVAMVGGPILIIALSTGLFIAIFQAMTQIQEQTLTFIPKIISIALVLLLLGPWQLSVLTRFATNLLQQLPIIGKM